VEASGGNISAAAAGPAVGGPAVEPPASFEVLIARPVPARVWVHIGATLMALSAGVMLAGIAIVVPKIAVLAALPLMVGFVALLAGLAKDGGAPLEVAGRLTAGAEGLRINGALIASRAALVSGVALPRTGQRPLMRLAVRGRRGSLEVTGQLELVVRDVGEARSLLRALGLDATQTVVAFGWSSRVFADLRIFALVMAPIVAVLVAAVVWAWTGALPLAWSILLGPNLGIAWLVVAMSWPTTVSVGADGVAIAWLGRRRFVGYDDIIGVASCDARLAWGVRRKRLELHLRSGEIVRLGSSRRQQGDDVEEVAERIRQAMESWRPGEPVADEAGLRRRGRSTDAWLSALRAIGAGAGADHRNAPVPEDRLWRVVEDPTAPPAARAGAAVALGSVLDQRGRARLRGAAGAIAAPKLRVAIETAADGTQDAELVAALAELDAAEVERVDRAPSGDRGSRRPGQE
jgi:hypothetical protein